MVVCQLDKSEHASYKDLNQYLLRLRYKQGEYYEEYHPRFDLLTKERIPYKNLEQYFTQDFVDKRNLKKWIKENPAEGERWAIKWLKDRKEEKRLIHAPSHLELRSLTAPSVNEYQAFIGGYEKACNDLGLICRYSYQPRTFPKHDIKHIIVDTREQNPLLFEGINMISAALKVGDYALQEPEDKGIYIERKSLSDFIGTMGKGLERFSRELERAHNVNHYVVMIVEENINATFSFNYLPHIKRHTKVQPSHIFKGLRDLLSLYPLIFQCVFVNGRKEATEAVKVILGMGEIVKSVDLQFEYEAGRLLT